jgi:hypothetical protein
LEDNSETIKYVSWHDESCLQWAIVAQKLEWAVIHDKPNWNRFLVGYPEMKPDGSCLQWVTNAIAKDRYRFYVPTKSEKEFFSTYDFSTETIAHFTGKIKPWNTW